jgi:hypothetical protein
MSEDDDRTRLYRVEAEQRKQAESLKAAWVILVIVALGVAAMFWWH